MVNFPEPHSTRKSRAVGGVIFGLAIALGIVSLGCSDGRRNNAWPQARVTPAYPPAPAYGTKPKPTYSVPAGSDESYSRQAKTAQLVAGTPARLPPSQTPPLIPAPMGGQGGYYDPAYRPLVGDHYVQGYFRRDGTYVRGHYRTNADDSFWNNWSSQGNV